METDRRQFVTGFLAGAVISRASPLIARDRPDPLFLSAAREPDGGYSAVIFSATGDILHTEMLPDRGHGGAFDPVRGRAVLFARRPGRFAMAFDPHGPGTPLIFSPPPDRHFYGHGFFSPDGALLYASENDFDAERGAIGVYDAADGFTRIGEFESGGIGPHEILLLPDGRTICVANGGILTHPDFPREKLNLSSMEPSLVYLDRRDGSLIERWTLPAELSRLSIRHLAVARDTVWFGCQYEGYEGDEVPLIGTHRPGEDIEFLTAPPGVMTGMKHYIGSVAASADGSRVATTSPRGNRLLVWDAATRTLRGERVLADVCGAAFSAHQLLATHGDGIFPVAGPERGGRPVFDNHLTMLNRS